MMSMMTIIIRPLSQRVDFLMGFFSNVVLMSLDEMLLINDGNGVEDGECTQIGKITNRDETGSIKVETQFYDFLFTFNLTYTQENRCFPPDVNLKDVLDLYFQSCSLEVIMIMIMLVLTV